MPVVLSEPAREQYDEYIGTVAADGADFTRVEQLLGIGETYWVLAVDITVYGGAQDLTAYGLPRGTTKADLDRIADSGEPIWLDLAKTITAEIPDHSDTNPPASPTVPVWSAWDFLTFGFKRLHIRLLSSALPDGATVLGRYEGE